MIEIIPAILAKTEGELRDKLALVPRAAEWVHVDFVENPPPYSPSFNKGGGGGRIFEAHLMLPDPRSHLDDLVRAGFSRVIVQVCKINPPPRSPSFIKEGARGGFFDPEAFAELLHEWRGSVEIAPSLEIETPLSVIGSFAHELTSVQLMGIAEIGAQGHSFDERVILRVRTLHAQYPHLTITVDGGVNKENAVRLEAAGATRLVVGSHIHEFYA